ncbi:zinc-ribbon domain-containing protein [Priestia megaterium]
MSKINIEKMKELAKSRDGECLSTEYINSATKLLWKCKHAHIWEAKPNNIKAGKWCPQCGINERAAKRRGSIKEMHEIASNRGGKCLSSKYISSKVHLKWQCLNGHLWEATPNNIKRGKWCPRCASKKNADLKRRTIKDMQDIAESKKGKCLSTEYVNMNSKLLWQCHKRHKWKALPSNIFSGKWCPVCAGKYRSIIDMQVLAEQRHGECLSVEYVDMKSKLTWRCNKGHVWKATPNSIFNLNSWCPICSGNSKKTIKDMRTIAKSRGGKCLSKKYTNVDTELRWSCSSGHEWKSTPYAIENGSWCPICNNNSLFFNEEKCRFILSSLLQKEFHKTRKELEKGLELDGYNEELRLAFEYNGIQHYSYNSHFHKSEDEFKKQQIRDKEKERLCAANSIKLIVIPYYIGSDLEKIMYVQEELLKVGIQPISTTVKWEYFYKGFNPLEELQIIAKERGGKCLSLEYNGVDEKLKWECEQGHKWESTPYYIKNGSWCPKCLGRRKTIEEMQELAYSRKGKCLSELYVNNSTKLSWQCEQGHKWEATPASISRGSWCPVCAGRLVTINDMHKLASKERGKCLSNQYINSATKLSWQCEQGHKWEATPASISRGSWCPLCNRKTIVDMNKLAEKFEGKCLSDSYRGSETKLTWQCSYGHQWKSSPSNIQRGRWCPKCTEKKRNDIKDKKLEELCNIAIEREGLCLANKYYDVDTKLKWRCKNGHEWESTPYSIKNGSWCPKCAVEQARLLKKGTIEQMHRLAELNEGKCLSQNYTNSRTKLRWKCKCGNEWKMTPNNVQQGSWCPVCKRKETSRKQRKSIEDMIKLARVKDGKCLSSEYVNAHTKLSWRCKHGHEWNAKPNNIQQGKWCPICAKRNKK